MHFQEQQESSLLVKLRVLEKTGLCDRVSDVKLRKEEVWGAKLIPCSHTSSRVLRERYITQFAVQSKEKKLCMYRKAGKMQYFFPSR